MLTIDHLRAFYEEATGKPLKQAAAAGTTNGIDWHVGPPELRHGQLQDTCPDCFRQITSGMTVYRPEAPTLANSYYRRSGGLPTTIYVCAACFDWTAHAKAHHTRAPERRHPTGLNAIKALDKITRELAPRFRIVARDDLKAMSEPELNLYVEAGNERTDMRLAAAAVRAEKRLRHLKVA